MLLLGLLKPVMPSKSAVMLEESHLHALHFLCTHGWPTTCLAHLAAETLTGLLQMVVMYVSIAAELLKL